MGLCKSGYAGELLYRLPKVLRWITGNIGYHHIHHLSPRVPNYNLESVHNKHERFRKVQTITLLMSLQSLRFRLWDQQTRRFVGFRDVKRLAQRESILPIIPHPPIPEMNLIMPRRCMPWGVNFPRHAAFFLFSLSSRSKVGNGFSVNESSP